MAAPALRTQTLEGHASVPHASRATESSDKNDLSASPQMQTWTRQNYSKYDGIKHGITSLLSWRISHECFGRWERYEDCSHYCCGERSRLHRVPPSGPRTSFWRRGPVWRQGGKDSAARDLLPPRGRTSNPHRKVRRLPLDRVEGADLWSFSSGFLAHGARHPQRPPGYESVFVGSLLSGTARILQGQDCAGDEDRRDAPSAVSDDSLECTHQRSRYAEPDSMGEGETRRR